MKQPIEEILGFFNGHRYEYLSLQFCLLKRLWVSDRGKTSILRDWLQNVRKNRDTIITTNYDTVLERGISKLTSAPDPRPMKERGLLNYGVRPDLLMLGYEKLAYDAAPGSITLLKLHGSISWSYCAKCEKAKLHPLDRNAANSALAGETCACGGELSPILVGPAGKQYEHPVIASVVNTASEILQQADEIVFAGFSMSIGDEAIRNLLAKAHNIAATRRVTVVDKQAERLKGNYKNVYGETALELLHMDWREHLKNMLTEVT